METDPPKEQPLPLTLQEPPAEDEDATYHPTSTTEEIPELTAYTEERTYVDADAEVTGPEEHSLDPYDITRDDPFALIPPEMVKHWDSKKKPPPYPQPQPPQSPGTTELDETLTAQPWPPESPPFIPPHIHVDDTEDLVSAESQSVRDPDDFRTPT